MTTKKSCKYGKYESLEHLLCYFDKCMLSVVVSSTFMLTLDKERERERENGNKQTNEQTSKQTMFCRQTHKQINK